MKNILFACNYGAPGPNTGGPNRIIFEILFHLEFDEFKMGYLSGHYENLFIKPGDITNFFNSELGTVQRSRVNLFNKYYLYRTFVSSRIYWDVFLLRNKRRFSNKTKKLKGFEIIHAHDIFSFYYLRNIDSFKILTVHSKGPARLDIQDYVGNKKLFPYQIDQINEMEMKSFEMADIVTFPSSYAKKMFLDLNNLEDSPKLKIIHNGINIEDQDCSDYNISIIEELKVTGKYDLFILSIAEHVKAKRLDKILEIIRYLVYSQRMNPLFLSVGKGPETNNLKSLVKEFQIEKNVLFIPYLNHSQVICLMKRFDIFLSLSERVIFDMVILEAMANGMFVVASNEGGNKEIINHGYNGYLVNSNEECIESILAFEHEIGNRARKDIEEFSAEKMVSKYKRLYLNG